MATIRPSALPAATSVSNTDAIMIDTGAAVKKATPLQIADAAIPLASQAEAEAGVDNVKRVTSLRVKQAIDAQTPSLADLASTATGKGDALIASDDGASGSLWTTIKGFIAYLRASTGAGIIGTALGHTAQAELDYQRGEIVDTIDFGTSSFAVPTHTALGRPVNMRVNGSAGTLTQGFDANGFLINTNPTGHGGIYVTADAGAKVYYQKFEFIIKSGGGSSPDQGSTQMMPWTADITQGTYAVPPTSMHMSLAPGSFTISEYTAINTAGPAYLQGGYAQGALAYDTPHVAEKTEVDGQIYWFVDGVLQPIATIPNPQNTGNIAGYELFKNNTNDGEPGIRRLEFSTSPRKAREVRDTYLRDQQLSTSSSTADQPVNIQDDFLGGNLTNGSVGSLGWSFANMGVAAATGTSGHPGQLSLSTNTVTATIYQFYLAQGVNVGSIYMQDFDQAQFVFKENAAGITDVDMRVGFTSDVSTVTPSNAFYLEALAADTNWFLVGYAAGVQTRKDTGIAKGTTNWLTLRFYRITATNFGLGIKINGAAETAVAELDGLTDHMPYNVSLLPMVQMKISGTTARTLKMDRFSLSIRSTAR